MPTGRSVSRFDTLKHAIFDVHRIMFNEKPEDLAELSAEYHEHHSPADSDQYLLVDTLVLNEWRIRRMRRVEADLWYHAYNTFVVKNIEVTLKCTSGDAFATDASKFERLQRVVNSCERAYHRGLKELHRLQSEPAKVLPGAFVTGASVTKVGQALPPANPGAPPQKPETIPAATSQPQQSKPASTSSASFQQNPQPPVSAPTNSTETRPPPVPVEDKIDFRRILKDNIG
jgi:hypothetical protein